MTYVTYEDFFKYVLPEVHGCPQEVVKNAIRDAVIEFCDKSFIWTGPSQETTIYAGYPRYTFEEREDDAIVSTVLYCSVSDTPIDVIPSSNLNDIDPYWRTLESNKPTACFMDTSSSLRLVGIPTEDIIDGLYIEVALKPSRDSSGCPEFLFEDWAPEISHGALAKLKAMSGRVWADTAMAAYHRAEFKAGISRAKVSMIKSNLRSSKTMTAKSFYGLI